MVDSSVEELVKDVEQTSEKLSSYLRVEIRKTLKDKLEAITERPVSPEVIIVNTRRAIADFEMNLLLGSKADTSDTKPRHTLSDDLAEGIGSASMSSSGGGRRVIKSVKNL